MLAFDTHTFYKRLESAGFTPTQSERITDLVKETQENSFEGIGKILASKEDLANTKIDLIKWIVSLLLAQTGIIAALVKLL